MAAKTKNGQMISLFICPDTKQKLQGLSEQFEISTAQALRILILMAKQKDWKPEVPSYTARPRHGNGLSLEKVWMSDQSILEVEKMRETTSRSHWVRLLVYEVGKHRWTLPMWHK